MSRKLFVLSIWVSVLSFFGCKPENREEVTFNEFIKKPNSDVLVRFTEDKEVYVYNFIKTKTRLQSKTTTVFSADVFCSTQYDNVYVVFRRTKKIPIHLKTVRDRKPYLDSFEKSVTASGVTNVSLSEFLFELDTSYSEFSDKIILREVKR